jgi:hypothetical protein
VDCFACVGSFVDGVASVFECEAKNATQALFVFYQEYVRHGSFASKT